jgi:hypothetical protein
MPTIENCTVTPRYINGEIRGYDVTPNEGYVLHTTSYDEEVFDEIMMEPTGEIILGFTEGTIILYYTYDFDNVVPGTYTYNNTTININKVGRLEVYAVPKNMVSENQIWGIVDEEHEVM